MCLGLCTWLAGLWTHGGNIRLRGVYTNLIESSTVKRAVGKQWCWLTLSVLIGPAQSLLCLWDAKRYSVSHVAPEVLWFSLRPLLRVLGLWV